MTVGQLTHAYAYEVAPRQQDGFLGGAVGSLSDLSEGLIAAAELAKMDQAPHFNLRLDSSRSSVFHTALVTLAGSDKPGAGEAAARLLAVKLGASMDHRSHPCLLVVSVHQSPAAIATWMFPKENVILRSGDRISINEAFSLSSYLRKAAIFPQLSNAQPTFQSGQIVDRQSTTSAAGAARFWTDRFIEAEPQVTSVRGTTLVAEALRDVNSELDGDPEQRQALHTAVSIMRSRGAHDFSSQKFLDQDLPSGTARDILSKVLNDRNLATARFRLDAEIFETAIKFTVFDLSNGVRVTIPFTSEMPDDVSIVGNTLSVTGEIQSTKLRGRQ